MPNHGKNVSYIWKISYQHILGKDSAVKQQRTLFIPNVNELKSSVEKKLFQQEGVQTCLAMPLKVEGEDAEEVVQNSFFRIWEKRSSIDSSHSFKSFLFSIAYHTTIDLLRERLKERKYREIILASASSEYNPEEAIEFGDLLEQVEQIVCELPPRKLEIYTLSRKKHLSYNEIAKQLGITVKTVENSINFSLHFIKTRLGRDSILILLLAELFF